MAGFIVFVIILVVVGTWLMRSLAFIPARRLGSRLGGKRPRMTYGDEIKSITGEGTELAIQMLWWVTTALSSLFLYLWIADLERTVPAFSRELPLHWAAKWFGYLLPLATISPENRRRNTALGCVILTYITLFYGGSRSGLSPLPPNADSLIAGVAAVNVALAIAWIVDALIERSSRRKVKNKPPVIGS